MAKGTYMRMRNQFLMDLELLLINGQRNIKENEKPNPYGLRLASNQWPKELKDERETISLRIKTYFQLLAKET